MTQDTGTDRFVRTPDDRVLRGVCAAVGRATGTDPVLWRVAVGVLTLFGGGSGLLLYAAGWLLIPEQGHDSVAERILRGRGPSPSAAAVLVALAAVAVAGSNGSNGLVPLAVVGLVAFLVLRRGRVDPPTPPGTDWPAVAPAPAESSWYAPLGLPATGPGTVPPPVPYEPVRRARSPLGLLTLSAGALVVGLMLLLNGAGVPGITVSRVLAAALLVVGAGLLVGTVWGRSRLLVLVALLLGVALSASATLDPPLTLDSGRRSWVGAGTGSYELGAGEATLDLRAVPTGTDVVARVGLGHLVVLLPRDVPARVVYDVRAGQVDLPGGRSLSGERIDDDLRLGPPGDPAVTVHARLAVGELEVRDV